MPVVTPAAHAQIAAFQSEAQALSAGVPLPKTATEAELKLVAGLALLGLSLVLLVVGARRRTVG